MTGKILFVETEKQIKNFFFLTDINSTFELNPLFEKIIKYYNPAIVVRKELIFKLKKYTSNVYNSIEIKENSFVFDALFIPFKITDLKKEALLENNGEIVGAFIKSGVINAPFDFEKYKNLDVKNVEGIYIDSFYELPYLIPEIVEMVLKFDKGFKKIKKNLYLKKGEIKKGVFIDTEEGPIIIEEIKNILPPVTLKGPLYIGKDVHLNRSFIKNSFLKDVLRLGGEIDSSIFYGFSNKAHEGYVGHSVIGKWVNLGALTTTSDLKNTYSEIRVNIREDQKINTKKIKLGSFIGDHVQTGIGTLLSTGTVIMPFCNLYGGLNFKGFIKPFTWWGDDIRTEYNLQKAIEVAGKMMDRRNIKMEEEYVELIKNMYRKYRP